MANATKDTEKYRRQWMANVETKDYRAIKETSQGRRNIQKTGN
jgi:hypothetical protein